MTKHSNDRELFTTVDSPNHYIGEKELWRRFYYCLYVGIYFVEKKKFLCYGYSCLTTLYG